MARRKRIGRVRFQNGARMNAYLLPQAHPGADASDVVEVELRASAASYGEGADAPIGWYMNAYDIQNLAWMLSGVTLCLMEQGAPLAPADMQQEVA